MAVTEFHYDSADKYNWNNLDRYICENEKENSQLNEVNIVCKKEYTLGGRFSRGKFSANQMSRWKQKSSNNFYFFEVELI